jgi:hypothetical protein
MAFFFNYIAIGNTIQHKNFDKRMWIACGKLGIFASVAGFL